MLLTIELSLMRTCGCVDRHAHDMSLDRALDVSTQLVPNSALLLMHARIRILFSEPPATPDKRTNAPLIARCPQIHAPALSAPHWEQHWKDKPDGSETPTR